jgi:hypothetical protein
MVYRVYVIYKSAVDFLHNYIKVIHDDGRAENEAQVSTQPSPIRGYGGHKAASLKPLQLRRNRPIPYPYLFFLSLLFLLKARAVG